MWDNCGQQISLDELAGVARYSKFYFVRRFRAETRCSPVRFLSAIRLARSKHLLATTPTNISDIAHSVGYLSYGTFTSRFTEAVGLSPSQYRRHARGERIPLRWDESHADGEGNSGTPSFIGKLRDRSGTPVSHAYVSVCPAANPLSSAAASLIIANNGRFTLNRLPPGRWFVRAISASPAVGQTNGRVAGDVRIGSVEVQLGRSEPLEIRIILAEQTIRTPPFLLALPRR
ncbi:helix-turn-helix domain-containing protein [Nocardia transvalensis]|uniref:helix-turn-helix domain-containing protein n=1 Tax=Nocardia transvalensis TaxID=37333 RepID=UPI003A5CA8E2